MAESQNFTEILSAIRTEQARLEEHERYFVGVVGFMRDDRAGLDAAISRMRQHVLANFDDDETFVEDEEFREAVYGSLEQNETWMRAKVEQARAIVALADGDL